MDASGTDPAIVRLVAAFPRILHADAAAVAALLPPARLGPTGGFAVSLDPEPVCIPYRIYNDEPGAEACQDLPPVQRTVLSCLYTRHHDGFVRQRHLDQVVTEPEIWGCRVRGPPHRRVRRRDRRPDPRGTSRGENTDSPFHNVYGHFAAANTDFLTLTRRQAASYWDCCYRNRYTDRSHYPAYQALATLRDAARRVGSQTDAN